MLFGAPLECLATDFICPLPFTKRKNRYFVVFMDYFTKCVEAFPVPELTTERTVRVYHQTRYSCPIVLHSSQGRNYESRIFKELCELQHIKKARTTARNPKCNGMAERFNRTLIRLIKVFIVDAHDEWDLKSQDHELRNWPCSMSKL